LSFIEQTEEHDPSGIDIGAVEGEVKLAGFAISTVMDGVDLEKAGFSLVPGVMGTNGNMFFYEVSRFGTADGPLSGPGRWWRGLWS
jgi:hypothetical protein